MEELIHDFMIVNFGINPPVGEIYHAIEDQKENSDFILSAREKDIPGNAKSAALHL